MDLTRPPVEVYPHNHVTYGFTKTTSHMLPVYVDKPLLVVLVNPYVN